MTSIEEAYRPFAEAKRRLGKARAADAARALALAVHEHDCASCSRARDKPESDWLKFALEHCAVRRRIEALVDG